MKKLTNSKWGFLPFKGVVIIVCSVLCVVALHLADERTLQIIQNPVRLRDTLNGVLTGFFAGFLFSTLLLCYLEGVEYNEYH